MLQRLIHRLLMRRHFWRHATFSEIAELYASRTLRTLALRMTAAFISIYLFQLGFSLLFIALFWAAFFAIKVPSAFFAALIASRIGPKHGVFVSNLCAASGMLLLAFVPQLGLAALVPWAILQAFSVTVFELCYTIDFSKVKHPDHAGKELGFMNMLEKVATGISPLIGGLIALAFGPQAAFIVSGVLFIVAAWPLLQTAEQVETHQRFSFDNLSWKLFRNGMVGQASIGFDIFSSGSAWTLFLTIAVLGATGDEIYAQIGALLSITLLVAFAASYSFGVLIDRNRGGELMRISTVFNSIVHLVRPFATTPLSVGLINAANEIATSGCGMAFTRGTFDAADDSGDRVAYLFLMEAVSNIGASLAAVTLALLVWFLQNDTLALQVFFFVAAVAVLGNATPKFALYRR